MIFGQRILLKLRLNQKIVQNIPEFSFLEYNNFMNSNLSTGKVDKTTAENLILIYNTSTNWKIIGKENKEIESLKDLTDQVTVEIELPRKIEVRILLLAITK